MQTVGVSGGEVGTAKTEPRELLTLRRSAPARPSCHFEWVPTTPHFRQGDRCCSAKSNGFGKGPSLSAHTPQRRPDRGAVPRDEEGGTDDWTARGERMDDVSEVLSSEVFRGNAYSLENELSAFPHSTQYHAITCGSFGSFTVSIKRSISLLQRGHFLFMAFLILCRLSVNAQFAQTFRRSGGKTN